MGIAKEVLKAAANRFRIHAAQQQNKSLPLIEWGPRYMPQYFTRAMSDFHRTLAREYDDSTFTRGKKLCVIAPRGNAKTTMTTNKVLKAISEQTEQYIIIISDTAKQAEGILDGIKSELETNESLRRDYPLACSKGPVWNTGRIETANGICIEALGTGQKVRGRKYKQYRPTLVILDDPDNDEDIKSPAKRVSNLEWFNKALLEVGDTNTNYFVIGTMLHRECIVGAIERRPDFRIIKFQSIRKWPTRMDLWDKWTNLVWTAPVSYDTSGAASYKLIEAEKFYDTNYDDMNAGASVLWPEKEDLYDLMLLRATRGQPAFMSEKQNDPRDPTKCEFREEWFENTEYDFDDLLARLAKEEHISVMYADPAKGGETKKHDYSPIITLHWFGEHYCYVEIEMEKIPVVILKSRLIQLYKALGPWRKVISFESNGFQELIGDDIYEEAMREGVLNLNLVPLENYNVHKNTRISRLATPLQRKFFRFKKNCPHTLLLKQQLLEHPHADHDDGSDALEACLRMLNKQVGHSDENQSDESDLPSTIN